MTNTGPINKDDEHRHLILGVDPGLGGALAYYNFKQKTLDALYDIPTTEDGKGNKAVDVYALAAIIQTHAEETLCAVIEDVGAAPKQGLSSTFKFGRISGILAGVVASSFIPIYFVKPAVWKVGMGLQSDGPASKGRSLDLAKSLFPEAIGQYFTLKKHHDRAEACLIAFFGEKMLELTSKLRQKERGQKNGN